MKIKKKNKQPVTLRQYTSRARVLTTKFKHIALKQLSSLKAADAKHVMARHAVYVCSHYMQAHRTRPVSDMDGQGIWEQMYHFVGIQTGKWLT